MTSGTVRKKANGYLTGTASIGNHPVHIKNCNGNSNVNYKQSETLLRANAELALREPLCPD